MRGARTPSASWERPGRAFVRRGSDTGAASRERCEGSASQEPHDCVAPGQSLPLGFSIWADFSEGVRALRSKQGWFQALTCHDLRLLANFGGRTRRASNARRGFTVEVCELAEDLDVFPLRWPLVGKHFEFLIGRGPLLRICDSGGEKPCARAAWMAERACASSHLDQTKRCQGHVMIYVRKWLR